MTGQITLDGYRNSPKRMDVSVKEYERVRMLTNFSVAWKDRDWHLNNGDIVEIDSELASMLVGRKMAQSLLKLKNRIGD